MLVEIDGGGHTHTHCFGMVHHQVSWVFLHFQGSFYGRARLSECVSVFNKNEMNNMVLLWPGDRSWPKTLNIMLSNLYFDRLINSIDSRFRNKWTKFVVKSDFRFYYPEFIHEQHLRERAKGRDKQILVTTHLCNLSWLGRIMVSFTRSQEGQNTVLKVTWT